jgi:hypothetical protein
MGDGGCSIIVFFFVREFAGPSDGLMASGAATGTDQPAQFTRESLVESFS